MIIAGKTVRNISDFRTTMGEERDQSVSMQIQRDGRAMGIVLPTVAP